jgi:Serine aminopeptidase, S33
MSIALLLAGAYAGVLLAAIAWRAIVWTASVVRSVRSGGRTQTEDTTMTPDLVVTLVHGTWARRADWTMTSSPLCAAICEAAHGPVKFEPFLWSGWNTVTSRSRAVTRLISQLRALQTRWPHARHFVIGHSHGGNIAFQAMRERSVAKHIVGVACLSTPFLCVSPRELGPVGRIALWWFPVVVVLFCLVPAVKLVPAPLESSAGGIAMIMAVGFAFWIYPRVTRFATTVADALQHPDVPPSKVLIVRTFGDEASAVLGAAHMISWLAELIWSTTSRFLGGLLSTVETWRSALAKHWRLVLPACAVLLGLTIVALATTAPPASLQVGGILAAAILAFLLAIFSRGGYVAAFLGALLIALLATPCFLVIAVLGIATGPELLIAALVFRVTAESTPPGGGWTVWQVPTDPRNADPRALLMHSTTYQDAESLHILVKWLEQLER